MPIIAQELVQINANDDLTVVLLDKINSCRCVETSKLSLELNTPLETLKNSLAHIAGIKCDDDYEICCIDQEEYDIFVNNLKNLTGE